MKIFSNIEIFYSNHLIDMLLLEVITIILNFFFSKLRADIRIKNMKSC